MWEIPIRDHPLIQDSAVPCLFATDEDLTFEDVAAQLETDLSGIPKSAKEGLAIFFDVPETELDGCGILLTDVDEFWDEPPFHPDYERLVQERIDLGAKPDYLKGSAHTEVVYSPLRERMRAMRRLFNRFQKVLASKEEQAKSADSMLDPILVKTSPFNPWSLEFQYVERLVPKDVLRTVLFSELYPEPPNLIFNQRRKGQPTHGAPEAKLENGRFTDESLDGIRTQIDDLLESHPDSKMYISFESMPGNPKIIDVELWFDEPKDEPVPRTE